MIERRLSARDQAVAAAVENWLQNQRRTIRGARGRVMMEADAAPIYRELLRNYRHAFDQARERYEQNTPRDQWVVGRARWAQCEDLRGAAPSHWSLSAPAMLLCFACWEESVDGLDECERCGRRADSLIHISVADRHSPVTLHALVCGHCYPEGVDAPVEGRGRT